MKHDIDMLRLKISELGNGVSSQQKLIRAITERVNALEATLVTKRTAVKFKTTRQKDEFDDIRLDPRIKVIIYALSGFAMHRFGKDIVLTDIYREQEEQDSVYSDNPNYVANPWYSVHQFWRGIDVRTKNFSNDEVDELVDFLNLFIYTGKYKTAVGHNIRGEHIHVQCDSDGKTVFV